MPSDTTYMTYVLGQLSSLEDVCARKMMGEYVLYQRGKVVGGVYDNRLLLKPVPELLAMVDFPELELPYEGGKPMLKVPQLEDRKTLCAMVLAVSDSLPEPKARKR